MITTLATIAVCVLVGTAGLAIASRISKSKWVMAASCLTCIVSVYLVIAWWGTVPPSYVRVNITSPKPATEVDGFKITVQGDVLPQWARVYVLVHPSTTDQWWVQDLPQFRRIESEDKPAIWSTTAYLGTEELGATDYYDIIALASSDPVICDILTGRYLRPSETVRVLPLLNQSNPITVKRIR